MSDQASVIVPRRNFLIRALGFTAAGATVPIPITALADAKARIEHHQAELEKAWRDYYGPSVRLLDDRYPAGSIAPAGVRVNGQPHDAYYNNSVFMIAAGGGDIMK